MQADASTFIHILAFQCPQCEKPVLEWMLSPMRSPESIDGATFNLKCSCGWSDGWLGAQARRHQVLPWPASTGVPSAPQDPGHALESKVTGEKDTMNTL